MSPHQRVSESPGGLRTALAKPSLYRLLQGLIRGERAYRLFVDEYVHPQAGMRILDLGCGTADVLSYLPDVEYVGVDVSEVYIEAARKRYPTGAIFIVQDLDSTDVAALGPASFDVVLAIGVLHHLSDATARALFKLAAASLEPGGRFLTLDGCYTSSQSRIAHFLLSRDRGEYVRNRDGYIDLARSAFASTTPSLRHDLFRFPYTCMILTCSKPHAV